MSYKEIPKAYEYQCDHCCEKYLQENAVQTLIEQCPDGWIKVRYYQQGRGWQEVLYCILCAVPLLKVVEREPKHA